MTSIATTATILGEMQARPDAQPLCGGTTAAAISESGSTLPALTQHRTKTILYYLPGCFRGSAGSRTGIPASRSESARSLRTELRPGQRRTAHQCRSHPSRGTGRFGHRTAMRSATAVRAQRQLRQVPGLGRLDVRSGDGGSGRSPVLRIRRLVAGYVIVHYRPAR